MHRCVVEQAGGRRTAVTGIRSAHRPPCTRVIPPTPAVYPIAQVPKMCFGGGSHFPAHIGWERMGSNHDLLRFRARGFPAFVSVHWTSCMPYISHVKTWDNVTNVQLAHDMGASGGSADAGGHHARLRTHSDDFDDNGDGGDADQQHLLVRPKWQSLQGIIFHDAEVCEDEI